MVRKFRLNEHEYEPSTAPKRTKVIANQYDEETLDKFAAPIVDHSAELAALDPAMAKVHITLRKQ